MENRKKNFPPDDLLKAGAARFGTREIEAAKGGDLSPLLGKLSSADRKRVETVLGDREALRKLTENPQVQNLMRQLNGNG